MLLRPLGPVAVIISIFFFHAAGFCLLFFLQMALSASHPFNKLTKHVISIDDSCGTSSVDNLAVRDLYRVFPWMLLLRFEYGALSLCVE